jgi:exosome complex exonuclease DIS3/RRP44
MNRAVHGDVVVVEMFDQKEWKAPADEVVDQEGKGAEYPNLSMADVTLKATLKNDDAEDSGEEGDDNNEATIKEAKAMRLEKRTSEKQPTGRVVGVIKRNWRA